MTLLFFGLISILGGGILSDRYGKKNPMALANICIFSAVAQVPFTFGAFLVTGNFWFSMACMSLKYLVGECWGGPVFTMI
jgi:MFS family permease